MQTAPRGIFSVELGVIGLGRIRGLGVVAAKVMADTD